MGGASTEIAGPARDGRSTSCSRRRTGTRASIARGGPPAQAAQRGVQALRAHGRPAAAAGRRRAGRAAARRARRRHASPPGRTDVGRRARGRAGADAAGPARPGGRRALPARGHRAAAEPGRLRASSWSPATTGAARSSPRPPSWRPDLAQPADLVEEVLRLEGYDDDPVGAARRARRTRAHPGAAPPPRRVAARWPRPATSRCCRSRSSARPSWDAFGLPADDVRRRTVHVLNPLDADRARARHHAAAGAARHAGAQPVPRRRATSRCTHVGQVVLPHARAGADARRRASTGAPPTPRWPRSAGRAARPAACTSAWCWPATGSRAAGGAAGGGGLGRRRAGRAAGRRRPPGVELRVTAADAAAVAPRPVRRAAGGRLARRARGGAAPEGRRGARAAAAHLRDGARPRRAPASLDDRPGAAGVAVPAGRGGRGAGRGRRAVPAAELADALLDGGGDLLEDVRLFDVYTGEQVGDGQAGRWPTRCASAPRTAR